MRYPNPQNGVTFIELLTTLAVAGILGAIALGSLYVYGSGNRLKNETALLVDHLWKLRSMAVTGQGSTCIDFPDSGGYRLFKDQDNPENGFPDGDTDVLIEQVALKGGLGILSVEGGSSPNHYVCFQARGIIGSANAPLRVKLGFVSGKDDKIVELLPSTGMAKVL